jgi:hypothetical protein
MVEMIMRVAASAIVSYPVVVFGVHVRRLRMALGIVEFTVVVLCRRRMRRSVDRCGTARRDMASADAAFGSTVAWGRSMCRRPVGRLSALVLSVKRQSEQQSSNCQSRKIFQAILQSESIISRARGIST